MFLGAICHDVCLELRKRRDAAIQKIASACNHMSVIKSRGNKIPEDSLAIYKGSIENGLREYIAVIDDFYKRPATPFDDQIVTWFNIQPHNWQKLLKDIRESLKEKVHA